MSDYLCFLITILYEDVEEILKCALKIPANLLSEDCIEYYMEPENKIQFWSLLPPHVREAGPIVAIERIYEVEFVVKKSDLEMVTQKRPV